MNVKEQCAESWRAEFAAALARTMEQRVNYSFIRTYKPVMDDATFRSFDTMVDYRQWCERELPEWLGYKLVKADHAGI